MAKHSIRVWLRKYAIYRELGYIPWHKPPKPRKPRRERRRRDGVYIGAREAIPFLNDDAKRTFSQLLFRPGYMMRDYVLRGEHERYLAPFTAMLVFYSVFTLLVAVVKPGDAEDSFGEAMLKGIQDATVQVDSTDTKPNQAVSAVIKTLKEGILLTRLDKHPEAVDAPWKESLAAVEGDIRSKGIPLFLGSFLLMWLSMAILLRKYQVSFSGAAAISGYILCQFCVFMFLALILSLGKKTELGGIVVAALVLIDYRQLLGVSFRKAFWLTVKTGLLMAAFALLFYLLLSIVLILVALASMR